MDTEPTEPVDQDVKPNIDSEEKREQRKQLARSKLKQMRESNPPQKRQSAAASTTPRKRKRNAQFKPNDQRTCGHNGQFLVWLAQGDFHKWDGVKDMVGDPNKEHATRNIVYSYSKQTAEQILVRQYLTWTQDWRAAAENAGIVVNRQARMFRDPSLTFVVANVVPYAQFSVESKYFKDKIIASDFVPYSNDNPAFKNRLSAFIVNVVSQYMCHTCPFYVRTDIGQGGEDRKYKIPFLKVSLTCKRPECNLRMTAIFKTNHTREGKLLFEIFMERFRTLSVLKNDLSVDNATRTFIAGSCGRCAVANNVKLLADAEPISEKEIAQYVRPSKRDAFMDKDSVAKDTAFDHSLTAFDVFHTVMRYNKDLVAHKDPSDPQTLAMIVTALGMDRIRCVPIHDCVVETLEELGYGTATIPFLNKLLFDSLDEEFKQEYESETRQLMQSFFDLIQSAWPNIKWPSPSKGRKPPAIKQEAPDSDSDDDLVYRSGIVQEEDEDERQEDQEENSYELVAEQNLRGYIRIGEDSDITGELRPTTRPTERTFEMDVDEDGDDIVFEPPTETPSSGLDANASAIVAQNPSSQQLLEQTITANREPKLEPTETAPQSPKRSCFEVGSTATLPPPVDLGAHQIRPPTITPPLPSILVAPPPTSSGPPTASVGRLVRASSTTQLLETPLERIMIPATAFQKIEGETMIAATDLFIFQNQ